MSRGEENPPLDTLIEDHVIRLLNQAVIAADEEYDDMINETLDAILGVGMPSFRQVAPAMHDSRSATLNLHSHLYPEVLDFRLKTINGKPAVVRTSHDESISVPDADPDPLFDSAFRPDSRFPLYSSSMFSSAGMAVSRLRVDGRDMLCRARRAGLQDPCT